MGLPHNVQQDSPHRIDILDVCPLTSRVNLKLRASKLALESLSSDDHRGIGDYVESSGTEFRDLRSHPYSWQRQTNASGFHDLSHISVHVNAQSIYRLISCVRCKGPWVLYMRLTR